MYAETGLMYPYFQNFSQDIQPLEDLSCYSQEPTSSLDSIITNSTISDYDLGGEGDLFKAPEPIIEEPIGSMDPMTAAIAMISCVDESGLKVSDMESLQTDQLLCDVFDGCHNELLEKTSVETVMADVRDIKYPLMMTNEVQNEENKLLPALTIPKSGSSGSLNSMEWASSAKIRPNFLDFTEVDFETAYGMRRAFSEGDIKTMANGNTNLIQRPLLVSNCTSEDRMQKLSRYRNKRSRRNFGRKIKYACRKALADSQPRIRGRFAKTEDADTCKKQ
ncbi:Zinc finger protein CO3 [Bienertia sinuspersici]